MLVGGGGNQHMENSICFVVFIFESFPNSTFISIDESYPNVSLVSLLLVSTLSQHARLQGQAPGLFNIKDLDKIG